MIVPDKTYEDGLEDAARIAEESHGNSKCWTGIGYGCHSKIAEYIRQRKDTK